MIPHVTNHDDADITDLEAFRVQMNKENEKSGVKISMLAFMIKAAVASLRKFPEFNASLDGDNLVLKQYYHIGFAADTPKGLVVPVIRDADQKGVIEIAKEMGELAKLARDGKLKPDQMQGGSFTISSLGGIGGIDFTPIINAPEVAIMGVCRSFWKQVSTDGRTSAWRFMLPLSLSWDHRVIDGAAAARFNNHFAGLLADMRRIVSVRSDTWPPIEVKVPDIGDFKDIPVIEMLVKPGDTVKNEDSLRHARIRQGDDGRALAGRGHGEGGQGQGRRQGVAGR